MLGGKRVLVRDYTAGLKELEEEARKAEEAAILAGKTWPDCKDCLDRAFEAHARFLATPHIVPPEQYRTFDELVGVCNALMKDFFGKLTAVLDYEAYTAQITMECCYLRLRSDHLIWLLQKMGKAASMEFFCDDESNMPRLIIELPCFVPDPAYRE